jgi:signal transduction histidine kinase
VCFLSGIVPRHSITMNAATPFPWSDSPAGASPGTTFRAAFEHAPIAVARCNPQGVIVDMNSAFERTLDRGVASRRRLRLCELVRPQDRDKTELLLLELLTSQRDSIDIEAPGAGRGRSNAKWTAWRQTGCAGEPDHALLILHQSSIQPSDVPQSTAPQSTVQPGRLQPGNDTASAEETPLQTQRWDAVGRLTGGVVHDFNNLLTGVMLYCDLLLSSFDARDRRRRYAEDIRSAIVQASGLVRQLLVFARPQATPARDLSLNEIALGMHGLLTRMIGENIALHLHLDPELGAVKIDQAHAQQIILNLVLNARDALPDGGQITVETSNCKFQAVAGTLPHRPSAFPCVLLAVGDNGHGMNAETRERLFEPFFTTKNAGQGTGLGLTTVRSIVTTNGGLIHFDSEPGRGTRAMILLPRASRPADNDPLDPASPDSGPSSETPSQEIKKESRL